MLHQLEPGRYLPECEFAFNDSLFFRSKTDEVAHGLMKGGKHRFSGFAGKYTDSVWLSADENDQGNHISCGPPGNSGRLQGPDWLDPAIISAGTG